MSLTRLLQRKVSHHPDGMTLALDEINANRSNNMSYGSLANKLNPHNDRDYLNVEQIEAIIRRLGLEFDVAEYFSLSCNAVTLRLPDVNTDTDMGMLDAFMDSTVKAGDFAESFRDAWADRVIRPHEFESLRVEMFEHIAAQVALLIRIEREVSDPIARLTAAK